MLTIEEIKKACEFADGFELVYEERGKKEGCFLREPDSDVFFEVEDFHKKDLDETLENVLYPLFLQRVIEGINSHFAHNDDGWFISQDPSNIKAYKYGVVNTKAWTPFGRFTFDRAKEEAIKYILGKLVGSELC